MNITNEQLEQIAELIQSCDNVLHSAKMPLPPSIHLEGLAHAVKQTRDKLREVHEEITGETYPHYVSA